MDILLKHCLPKGKDIIFLTSLETEVTQLFYLTYQLASSCNTYLSWNTLFINQWNQPIHASLTITSAVSYVIWELLPNRYVFCVMQLCVRLLPGSAQDIRTHNALKGLTSMEKSFPRQSKAGLGNQPQAATTGDLRKPHLSSLGRDDPAASSAQHHCTHVHLLGFIPLLSITSPLWGLPSSLPAHLDPPPPHTHLNSCLKSYLQAMYTN